MVIFAQKPLTNLSSNVSETYRELVTELRERSVHTPAVMRTLKFIETNFHREDLSLQHLADEIKINPTYLSRLLKSETGISFVEYLTHTRVRRAMDLLSDPTIRMQEVSKRVGFSNQHYFSTTFKKVAGISPGDYQKNRVTNYEE
jgi:two-component system response regulator YesN